MQNLLLDAEVLNWFLSHRFLHHVLDLKGTSRAIRRVWPANHWIADTLCHIDHFARHPKSTLREGISVSRVKLFFKTTMQAATVVQRKCTCFARYPSPNVGSRTNRREPMSRTEWISIILITAARIAADPKFEFLPKLWMICAKLLSYQSLWQVRTVLPGPPCRNGRLFFRFVPGIAK